MKKIIALMLALAVSLTMLASCGGDDEEENGPKVDAPAVEESGFGDNEVEF